MSQLDPEEVRELAEVAEVYSLSCTPGWGRIKDLMVYEVANAHEDMVGNVSNDPMTYMRLQLRWQQREALLRAVLDYVAKAERDHKRILAEIREREKQRIEDHDIQMYTGAN